MGVFSYIIVLSISANYVPPHWAKVCVVIATIEFAAELIRAYLQGKKEMKI